MGFEKIHIFARNPWVLAYGFTENCQFGAKIDRNSVFLGRDPRIANRLSITVPSMNLYVFKKIHIFGQNLTVLAYGITENSQFGAKTDQNSAFHGREPPYCESVIYNGPVFQFLWF
jgi:hypothetical protein